MNWCPRLRRQFSDSTGPDNSNMTSSLRDQFFPAMNRDRPEPCISSPLVVEGGILTFAIETASNSRGKLHDPSINLVPYRVSQDQIHLIGLLQNQTGAAPRLSSER